MIVLVTGAAGFIGFHTILTLLKQGQHVVGVDNLTDYYDVTLKEARLGRLLAHENFSFIKADIADKKAMSDLAERHPDVTHIIHLAAQAGVRYSLINPYAYTHANVDGQLVMMETARKFAHLQHMMYASSSSVYGTNTKLPFSVDDRTDTPVSLYAATKKSVEMMAHSYAHMFRLPLTGLRFFTVYGPWGRPDMSAFIFVKKILDGEPIPVFNNGEMRRDFTYIDDIVAGILGGLDKPPAGSNAAPHRVYNIGNHKSEPLMRFISLIEEALGVKAEIDFLPMQPGDVKETYADIDATTRDFGFVPSTSIDQGIPKFVAWYKSYHDL
ncbi:MAG: SDR family NAD(P)-dependent oxidoreductase [Rhodospirillales bacterium]|nr:SDR family NAD(P)-dependent oxidoreductase [Rhodospirillales bacterium]